MNRTYSRIDTGKGFMRLPRLDQANCIDADVAIFFNQAGVSENSKIEQQRQARVIKDFCVTCPERDPCLRYAIESPEPYGVWGGTTPAERKRIRRVLRRTAT